MFFNIQFLEKKMTSDQWNHILNELHHHLKLFKIVIHFQNDKVYFYLSSSKNPFSLNARISPLHIDDGNVLQPPQSSGTRFSIITGNLVDQILKFTTKKRPDEKSEFWIEISYGFAALLSRRFRKLRLIFPRSGRWISRISLLPVSIAEFLAFDFTRSAQLSIETVKPKLKVTLDRNLPLDSVGCLKFPNQSKGRVNLARLDFNRHSLVVGQSGSGKSEFLRLAVEELIFKGATNNSGIVVIDPHGKLYDQMSTNVPCYHLDPLSQQIQFFERSINPLSASELTLDLIESQLSKENTLDIRGKRVLRFVLFALYSAQCMSYENIARFLNDTEFRMTILCNLEIPVVRDFFETEYPELRTRYYDSAILPILNVIGEYQLSVSSSSPISFLETFNSNRVVVVSIPQGKMGSRLTKLYGATIVQQLFLYSQAGLLNKPYLVMIDELPLIYTPAFNQILAESRKFGLGLWVVQQYLSQLPQEALKCIFANMSNYFCFKTNNDDAELLAQNLNLEVETFTETRLVRSHKELASGALVDLSRGEVVARLSMNGMNLPATRLNTDIDAWSPRAEISMEGLRRA